MCGVVRHNASEHRQRDDLGELSEEEEEDENDDDDVRSPLYIYI